MEARGEFGIILLLPTTLLAIFSSGFTSTVAYSVATQKWKDETTLPAITGIAIYLSIVMLVIASVLLCLRQHIFPNIPVGCLLAAIALIPLEVLNQSFRSLLNGKQAFQKKLRLTLIVGPIRLLIFGTLIFFWPKNITIALIAQLAGAAIGTFFFYTTSVRVLSRKSWRHKPQLRLSNLRESLNYGGVAQIANLSGFLNYKADQFLVYWILGAAPLGIYVVAVALAERLWLFVSNISSVLFSITAENKQQVNKAEIAARVSSIVFWFNLVIATSLAIMSAPLVHFLYSSEFKEAGQIICWLLPGVTALGFAKVSGNYLAGIGKPGINAIGSIAGVLVNIAANLFLIPEFGLQGAAMATSISYISISVYSTVCFVRIGGLRWSEPFIPSRKDLTTLLEFGTKLARRRNKSGPPPGDS